MRTVTTTLRKIGSSWENKNQQMFDMIKEIKQDIYTIQKLSYSETTKQPPQHKPQQTPKPIEQNNHSIIKPNNNTPPQLIENQVNNIIKQTQKQNQFQHTHRKHHS